MSKFVIIQQVVAAYRSECMRLIRSSMGADLKVYCDEKNYDGSIPTGVDLGFNRGYVKNIYFFGGKFLWQWGGVVPAIIASVVIVEFNPRILSNWVILIVRSLMRRDSYVWGHVWSRKGPKSALNRVRGAMRSIAIGMIVYTEKQASELRDQCAYRGKIIVAPNSLYSLDDMQSVSSSENSNSFIYCGRLVKEKRVDLLPAALKYATDRNSEIKLLIVGDGPERTSLESQFTKLGVTQDKYKFFGQIDDILKLKELYSSSIFSISPGYVGLSITQSLGFGIPMIISEHEDHAPEIEAACVDENCILFDRFEPDALGKAIIKAYGDRLLWKSRRENISLDCRSRYSAEIMATRIQSAFKETLQKST
jgi:glycosyltransferase involved in cell wall biosynthesis